MALGTAEDQQPALWPDGSRKKAGYGRPQVIFDDRFDKSFCGWRQHMDGDRINPPLSLTDIRSYSGSRTALMIPVSDRPARQTAPAIITGENNTFKNLQLDVASGLLKFEAWIALGGSNLDRAPQQWFIGMDTQRWDEYQGRGFYRLYNKRFTGNVSTGNLTRVDAWQITSDTGGVWIDVPDAGSRIGRPWTVGDNENKLNVAHYSLTQDLDATATGDGRPGGYREAEIAGKAYDLRGLGAGRGKQFPQTVSGVGAASFAGGFNCGIGINNQTVDNEDGPSYLIVTRARCLWYPPQGA